LPIEAPETGVASEIERLLKLTSTALSSDALADQMPHEQVALSIERIELEGSRMSCLVAFFCILGLLMQRLRSSRTYLCASR